MFLITILLIANALFIHYQYKQYCLRQARLSYFENEIVDSILNDMMEEDYKETIMREKYEAEEYSYREAMNEDTLKHKEDFIIQSEEQRNFHKAKYSVPCHD